MVSAQQEAGSPCEGGPCEDRKPRMAVAQHYAELQQIQFRVQQLLVRLNKVGDTCDRSDPLQCFSIRRSNARASVGIGRHGPSVVLLLVVVFLLVGPGHSHSSRGYPLPGTVAVDGSWHIAICSSHPSVSMVVIPCTGRNRESGDFRFPAYSTKACEAENA